MSAIKIYFETRDSKLFLILRTYGIEHVFQLIMKGNKIDIERNLLSIDQDLAGFFSELPQDHYLTIMYNIEEGLKKLDKGESVPVMIYNKKKSKSKVAKPIPNFHW